MAWSTQQLAELAGTTVNTIRYYHRLGLLDEPERKVNGYKQYRARHLARLLSIRRLAELHVPLSQVDAVREGGEGTADVLRAVDAEIAASIVRLRRVRRSIDAVVREQAPADAPAGFESIASRLTEEDRTLLHLYARFYDADAMAELRRSVDGERESEAAMPAPDAPSTEPGETSRQHPAGGPASPYTETLLAHSWRSQPGAHLPTRDRVAARVIRDAARELYGSAQSQMLDRARRAERDPSRAERDRARAEHAA